MSGSAGFFGYPNEVFQVCTIASAWLNSQIANTPNVASTEAQTQNVFQTLRNGQQAVSAWQLAGAWTTELALLQQVQVLPLSLTTAQSAAFTARITALQNAIAALQAIIPTANIANTIRLLSTNNPAIAYPGVLEFYQAFAFETAPTGFTADQTVPFLEATVQNWSAIAQATLGYQTTIGLTQGYDEVARTTSALSQIESCYAQLTQTFTVLESISATQAWNQNVSLPALLFSASSITGSPSSQLNQQCGVIRTVLGTAINALALFLLSLRQPSYGQANLATLRANDSLMDIAARTSGNFEQWTAIATLNGLEAPWVGLANSMPGDTLLIPNSSGTTVTPGLPIPSYNVNVLGVDWYFGPLGGSMLPWAGDIPVIAGPSNLRAALTRRIMTPLSSLIYHTDYGSRIPPEVGEVQDTGSAQLITAFGMSALLSDPRVQSVLSASTTLNANGIGLDSFDADVQPVGTSGSNGVSVNAVLSPAP